MQFLVRNEHRREFFLLIETIQIIEPLIQKEAEQPSKLFNQTIFTYSGVTPEAAYMIGYGHACIENGNLFVKK